MGKKGEERLVDLHTYVCADGVCRTRCTAHIPDVGPYRPLMKKAFHVRRGVSWSRCVECYAEAEHEKRLKQEQTGEADESLTEFVE